jgi:hypothetical protein
MVSVSPISTTECTDLYIFVRYNSILGDSCMHVRAEETTISSSGHSFSSATRVFSCLDKKYKVHRSHKLFVSNRNHKTLARRNRERDKKGATRGGLKS